MKITDCDFVRKFMTMAQDGVDKSWHEMNGGNLSYHLTADEARQVERIAGKAAGSQWTEIGESVPELGGAFFAVTRTGGFMRNVSRDPDRAFGIVELDSSGTRYRIRWGLEDGGRPTSEFPSHLKNHEIKFKTKGHRVIYHAHPASVIAMTAVVPLNDRAFTRAIWEVMTECPVIFPEGIGVVKWMVPGKGAIATVTSGLMAKYDAVVWANHGLFCSGDTFDRAFGLMETIAKSAEIVMMVKASGCRRPSLIKPSQIRKIGKDFGLKNLNTKFL